MDKKDKKKAKRAQDAAAAQQTPAAGGSEETERRAFEQNQLEAMGTVSLTKGAHAIHCLTVIGQIEGHVEAPQGQKTTKYEHVIPQLVAVQEDPAIEGLLVLLNTVGGDVEAGLAAGVEGGFGGRAPLFLLFVLLLVHLYASFSQQDARPARGISGREKKNAPPSGRNAPTRQESSATTWTGRR